MEKLPDLKELGKVIDLCRKKGVSAIQLGELRIELGHDVPEAKSRNSRDNSETETDPSDPYANFPTGDLSPEQLAFYSAGGLPENDPFLKDS